MPNTHDVEALMREGVRSVVWEATVIRACVFCGGANPHNEPLCPGCGRKGNKVEELGVISEWHEQDYWDGKEE
jgi:hypothetical protein